MFAILSGRRIVPKNAKEKKLLYAEEEKRSNVSLPEFNGPPDGRGAIKSCGRN